MVIKTTSLISKNQNVTEKSTDNKNITNNKKNSSNGNKKQILVKHNKIQG